MDGWKRGKDMEKRKVWGSRCFAPPHKIIDPLLSGVVHLERRLVVSVCACSITQL